MFPPGPRKATRSQRDDDARKWAPMRNVIITYRRVLVVGIHIALWTIALFVAVLLRFEGGIPASHLGDGYGAVERCGTGSGSLRRR